MSKSYTFKWLDAQGEVIACKEKNKVMQENIEEFSHNCQDILEDAILMGCDENQVKQLMKTIIDSLENPYQHE